MAQESQDAEAAGDEQVIEEVVVTGFRQSLQNAMELKRDSDLIVEAISAEDIGKLPDNSIAEALTRLTGLAGQRLNGRQQYISIRGLSPDFSTALLNGRQQVSSGDNRGVEFDQYPSELLSGVVVYKTPGAALTGQGLAGTVDMRTISPLEYGQRTFAANVRNEWNSVSTLNHDADDSGLRYSLSYIDQFADGNVGLAIGYSHIASPSQRQVIDFWNYNNYAPADGARVVQGFGAKAQSGELARDGVMAVIEFQPHDRLSSTVDVYRSSFNELALSRQYSAPVFPAPWNNLTLTDFQVDDGLVTSGTIGNVKASLGNNLEGREADLWAAGWNIEWDVGDSWAATVDISHSAIEREDTNLALNSGTGPNGEGALDTLEFTLGAHAPSFSGTVDYSAPGATFLTSPLGWGHPVVNGGQVGYDNRPSIDDELTQIRIGAERYMDGPISSIDFGVQFDSRTKSRVNSNQGFIALASGQLSEDLIPTGAVNVAFGLPAIASVDPAALFDRGNVYQRVDHFGGGVHANDWTVDEDVSLAYAQFNIDTNMGNTPLTGNFGLQVVRTDQYSTGTTGVQLWPPPPSREEANTLHQVSEGDSYTNVLPSLNLNFVVADGQFVRLGVARTLARARMDEMRAGRSLNYRPWLSGSTDVNNSAWASSGGNPQLRPWVADSFDLSYELYFPDGMGYFAIAGFYKELNTYIYNLSIPIDFSEFPVEDFTAATTTGLFSRPVNGDGGEISGLEISVQVNGEVLAPELQGFGAVLNASFTDSEIERGTGDPSTPLPGLSENVRNLTLFYEQGGFSARVSHNYRSDFLGEVQGFGASRTLRFISEENLVDAQLSYSFEGGQLDGLTLYLQGTNLTDEPFSGFLNDDPRQVKDWQEFGSTYFFGGSYRY